MKGIMGNKGVTLIELITVVAIIGILATIAVPSYIGWLPKIRVDGAAGAVAGDLQVARLKAVSDNVPYVVYFDADNNTYNIYRDADAHFITDASPVPNPAELYKSVDISKEYKGIVFGQNVNIVPPGAPTRSDISIGSGLKVKFKSDFTGVPDSVYEIFRPDGTAVYTGVMYLIPQDDLTKSRYDRNKAVTVDAMTGFAKTWSHNNSVTDYWN